MWSQAPGPLAGAAQQASRVQASAPGTLAGPGYSARLEPGCFTRHGVTALPLGITGHDLR